MPHRGRRSFSASDACRSPTRLANTVDQDQPEPDEDIDAVFEEAQVVRREVFRELCFSALHFGPPPPPPLLGDGGAGAPEYPPSTRCRSGSHQHLWSGARGAAGDGQPAAALGTR